MVGSGSDLDNKRPLAISFFFFFSLKIGEDQKEVFMSADVVFSLKLSLKTKKVFVVRDQTPHFFRGPRLLSA